MKIDIKYKKLSIAGCCLLIFGILFHLYLPNIIYQQLRSKVTLAKGKLRRFIWEKPPFYITYKFFLFNVTNPVGVSNGEKPILQEVGPFVYDTVYENTDVVDNDEDDTILYSPKYTYFFNANKSQGLTGDEEVVVPNYFILHSVHYVSTRMSHALPILDRAIDSIFFEPDTVFIRAKAKDVLFDGLSINCNVSDFAGSIACSEIKESYKKYHMAKGLPNEYLFSLWQSKNGTVESGRLKVLRGLKNLRDVGKVVEYDNKSNISVWDDPHCDKIDGTDGSIFHPLFDKSGKEPLVMYVPLICRTFYCKFQSESQYFGIQTLRYLLDMGTDGDNEPLEKCYCDSEYTCLKKGVYDMYECLQLPVVLSNPHFYQADPTYLEDVDGLQADQEKHESYIDIDPLSGSPLYTVARVQYNMWLMREEKVRLMRNVPELLLPLFWTEEEIATPDFLMDDVISGHILVSLATTAEVIAIVLGLGLCACAAFLQYRSTFAEHDLVSKDILRAARKNNDNQSTIGMSNLQPTQVFPSIN